MNKEINKIIADLEGCFGIFDYVLTPIESNLLVSYIKELQQENKKLKNINKEYERLNKENNRGFKITNVQKYNIDELLSYKKYKDNWNNIKRFLQEKDSNGYEKLYIEDILEVMKIVERRGNETNKG